MIPQRCPDETPHGPHPVPADETVTGFTCAGYPGAAEIERQLDAKFGEQWWLQPDRQPMPGTQEIADLINAPFREATSP